MELARERLAALRVVTPEGTVFDELEFEDMVNYRSTLGETTKEGKKKSICDCTRLTNYLGVCRIRRWRRANVDHVLHRLLTNRGLAVAVDSNSNDQDSTTAREDTRPGKTREKLEGF